jgi:RNA polymerase sigma factor (TIGR02999 family)
MSSSKNVTQLLKQWQDGDREALDKLMPLVYDELHRIAANYMKRERPEHTLQTTGLLHETYMKLVGEQDLNWQNRAHFFALAAQMMRRILVNHAVARNAEKRGGSYKFSLDEVIDLPQKMEVDIVELNDVLKRLAAVDERKGKIIELRFFAGLTNEEIAEILGVSLKTVKRDWRAAKAWLYSKLIKDTDKKYQDHKEHEED